jgi:glycosyltransferase involved in cell wall biosynthesis
VKDPFGLLEAMRLLTRNRVDFTLDIFGEDTLGGAVQRHCQSLGLGERVTFHGFVPNDKLKQQFDRADLLVINSRHEAALIVLLEAAACGVPTVGTQVGYIADWAPEASVAVPVGDPAALASAIKRLAHDEEERMRLARVAHARALAYTADDYARRVRRIYADVAAR